jgi:hypothetical protein
LFILGRAKAGDQGKDGERCDSDIHLDVVDFM